MKLVWWSEAWDSYVFWQSNDPDVVRKVNELVKDAMRSPFRGLGKPEPLRGQFSGWWSRRITREHRFIYRVTGVGETATLEILSCRFHY